MQGLSCFVVSSLREGISNTILVAMPTGLPVSATAVEGNVELVTARRTGKFVPTGDAQAKADCVLKFAANPQQLAAMGSEGRADAESRFSMEMMVESYLRIYDRELTATSRH